MGSKIKYVESVKTKNFRIFLVFLLVILPGFASLAQILPDTIERYLLSDVNRKDLKINYPEQIQQFYALRNYQTAWIQQKDSTNLINLLATLSSAEDRGLSKTNYQYSFISSFQNGNTRLETQSDSLKAEILFSDAAIHFYRDIVYGNTIPSFSYMGIKYIQDCYPIPEILEQYISKHQLNSLPPFLSPRMPEVVALQNKIHWIVNIMKNEKFTEATVTLRTVSPANKALCNKLFQLGILNSIDENPSETILKEKIRQAQYLFNLPVNGELNQEVIRELNIPLKARLAQLTLSVNYYRWISCLTQNQSVIVVNIPAAYLKVYRNNHVILEMRLVVGKPSTPTFTLTSVVNEVVVYPYWYVPPSIAVKELLPAIKRNPSFLDANNYQVLNKAGKIIDPYSVNWHALSRNYFPYTIRQGTGCDNSLGLLKLNFYNPFGAYLHDTPSKNLFKQQHRFFSHGCMRMEKPIELGHLILKNNQIAIDTLTEKGCLNNQSPITVTADVKMPVIVWYNPAGVDSTGTVLFFEDVYQKFNWMK